MFKFALSVRAYNYGRRYGDLPYYEDLWAMPEAEAQEACLKAGLALRQKGKMDKQAVELFRAAGLGLYNIYELFLLVVTDDTAKIRKAVEDYDRRLHGRR